MFAPRLAIAALLVIAGAPGLRAELTAEQLDRLPPASTTPVDFNRDVRPILEASCVKCHGRGKSKGGFQLDTRETSLKNADSGPAVVLGDSRNSRLIHLVSGLDPGSVMPEKGTKLTASQVGLLRGWIDQGLKWAPSVSFAREPHRNLQPRKPQLPPAQSGVTHPVDRIVAAYLARNGVTPHPPVDDRAFARRVWLDTIGLLPEPAQLDAFLRDSAPDKRARLVRTLLADNARFAQNWLTFWNDLLRNDYRGTGYIDGGREQISTWLYAALRDNKPYDAFVRELLNPGEGPAKGFVKGIVWRGVVNSSQTPYMQAAQNISQVFLGVNLKCASCHDSFIDDWQLADAYAMAGIYADERLELVLCDKPLGKHVPVRFIFPEIGGIPDDAPRSNRVARLAELVTSSANGRFPRTIVNRLWARLLGRGLVEPLDVMQNSAWDPDLLDWLAEALVARNYDLKHTIELILTSRAYQLPTVDLPEKPSPDFVFRGPGVRRLSAEQFRDALAQLTGVWHEKPEGGLDSLLVEKGTAAALPVDAAWIWPDPHAAETAPPQTAYFRRTIELAAVPAEALAFVNADNSHRLWVNGKQVSKRADVSWNETSVADLRPLLRQGTNVFAIEATNGGEAPNPAGLLFYARLRNRAASAATEAPVHDAPALDVASDAAWVATTNRVEGWEKPGFDASGWRPAHVLGPAGMAPWNLGAHFAGVVSGRSPYGNVRAAFVPADPLTLALGRPNREQVTSTRPSTATTIQMLELTNGETLSRTLKAGATRLVATSPPAADLVERVFAQGLGRKPAAEEGTLSVTLVGSPPSAEGVEDLLWAIALLPEFQLVY